MSKVTRLCLLCCIISLGWLSVVHAATDPRLMPITASQLRIQVLKVPLSSHEHSRLIGRAYISRLLDIAYPLYTGLAKQHPKDASAQVWAGLAAVDLQLATMNPDQQTYYQKKLEPHPLSSNLFLEAKMFLSKACMLAPEQTLAERSYGWFLWQYGNDMPRGLRLLQQAEVKAPTDAEIHCLLGAIHANQSGNAYNLEQAMQELQRAVMLDPSYAQAHLMLSRVYMRLNNQSSAQVEQKEYQSLLPAQRT